MSPTPPSGVQKSMAWAVVDGVIVLVHGEQPPTDAEWRGYVEETAKLAERGATAGPDGVAFRALVFSTGGGPTAAQRRIQADRMKENPEQRVRVAVVTTSQAARGIVTVMGWFRVDIKAFAPTALEPAFEHLGVHGDARARLATTLRRLADGLGIPDSVLARSA